MNKGKHSNRAACKTPLHTALRLVYYGLMIIEEYFTSSIYIWIERVKISGLANSKEQCLRGYSFTTKARTKRSGRTHHLILLNMI